MVDFSNELLAIAKNLNRNHFKVILAKNSEDAKRCALDFIPPNSSIGIANSVTVRQVGVIEALRERGDHLVDPISLIHGSSSEFSQEVFMGLMRKSLETDVFLSGTNAITQDGKLVNIDGLGNRVAGIIWAKGKVLIPIQSLPVISLQTLNTLWPNISLRPRYIPPERKLRRFAVIG